MHSDYHKKRVTGLRLEALNSLSSLTTHVTSAATATIALYSASDEDLLIVPCFLDFHDIGDLPNNRM